MKTKHFLSLSLASERLQKPFKTISATTKPMVVVTARLLPVSPSMQCAGGCLLGGCLLPGGVCHSPLWTEWQTGVKTLPCRNFLADGNKIYGRCYRPQTKLWEGNVLILVCQSFCLRGMSFSRSRGLYTHRTDTLPKQTPNGLTPPPETGTWAGGMHPTEMHSCYHHHYYPVQMHSSVTVQAILDNNVIIVVVHISGNT